MAVLVGMGKVNPEVLQYLLFALIGKAALPAVVPQPSAETKPSASNDEESDNGES